MNTHVKSTSKASPALTIAALLSLMVSFGLAGCDRDEGPVEEAAEEVENAAEEAGDAVEDAADEAEDEL